MTKLLSRTLGLLLAIVFSDFSVHAVENVGLLKDVIGVQRISLSSDQMQLLSFPWSCLSTNQQIQDVICGHIPTGCFFYKWDSANESYQSSSYDGSKWDAHITLTNNDVFWLYCPQKKTTKELFSVFLTGKVPLDHAFYGFIDGEKWLPSSFSYPVETLFQNLPMLQMSEFGDQICLWDIELQQYRPIRLTSDGNSTSNLLLHASEGFWCRTKRPRTWVNNRPYRWPDEAMLLDGISITQFAIVGETAIITYTASLERVGSSLEIFASDARGFSGISNEWVVLETNLIINSQGEWIDRSFGSLFDAQNDGCRFYAFGLSAIPDDSYSIGNVHQLLIHGIQTGFSSNSQAINYPGIKQINDSDQVVLSNADLKSSQTERRTRILSGRTIYANSSLGNDAYDGLVPFYTGGTNGPKKAFRSALAICGPNDCVQLAEGNYTSGSAAISKLGVTVRCSSSNVRIYP